ncbi:MAG TPA: hypothetical protein VJA23_00780 [Candidatus Nanoarchaeia archaeon]|nr:hypothetical protein [Candidatus Nanoarchaeia archaeon]
MKKRGIAAGQLVIIMITLVAFVLIAGTISRFISKAEGKEAEIICHDSLALKANTKLDIGIKDISTPALCKTLDKKFSASTQEEAMDFMALAMERCWWIWLEGQYDELFGSSVISVSKDKTKCFVCSTLIYEEGPAFSKLDFLNNLNQIKSKYRGGGSILSYIQENGYTHIIEESFNSQNVYAVVFASNIDENFWTTSGSRSMGFEIPYHQNGIWLLSMNRLEAAQPCYYQPDIAGE